MKNFSVLSKPILKNLKKLIDYLIKWFLKVNFFKNTKTENIILIKKCLKLKNYWITDLLGVIYFVNKNLFILRFIF